MNRYNTFDYKNYNYNQYLHFTIYRTTRLYEYYIQFLFIEN